MFRDGCKFVYLNTGVKVLNKLLHFLTKRSIADKVNLKYSLKGVGHCKLEKA